MSRRRPKRTEAARPRSASSSPRVERGSDLRPTEQVVRLAYTRAQAAEALGVSRSTFIRRVLPYVETVGMPWGAVLVPADELERLLAERRRPANRLPQPPSARGRPAAVPAVVVADIRTQRAEGLSFGRIAARLNADGVPTSHGGARWWPSTVRSVLLRSPRAP